MGPEDIRSLFDANFHQGGKHALGHGLTDELAYLKKQERLTFARVGITDPLALDDYIAHDGYRGLRKALAMQSADIVQQVTDSGLRGRGGAAFPTGIKWKTVLNAAAAQKYIVCNADEGDSGTFADRMLMEGDPFLLIEGMTIAALAVGATQGYFQLSQFKRSAIPNGPKVGSGGSLSPRGDWRAPSDAEANVWLEELRQNVPRSEPLTPWKAPGPPAQGAGPAHTGPAL